LRLVEPGAAALWRGGEPRYLGRVEVLLVLAGVAYRLLEDLSDLSGSESSLAPKEEESGQRRRVEMV
jgi:hypothetical protein